MTDSAELRRRARQHEAVAEETTAPVKSNRHEGIAEGYERAADLLETAPDTETVDDRTRRAETLEIIEFYPSGRERRTYRPAPSTRDVDAVLDIEETSSSGWRAKGTADIPALKINGAWRFGDGDGAGYDVLDPDLDAEGDES
jgi:hypothetical protein